MLLLSLSKMIVPFMLASATNFLVLILFSNAGSGGVVLVNAYSCSRCGSSGSTPVFPAFSCLVPNTSDPADYEGFPYFQGFIPNDLPNDKFPCLCPTQDDGTPIEYFRFPISCEYSPPDPGSEQAEDNVLAGYDYDAFGLCGCYAEYPDEPLCKPDKCDYAFQCEEDIYVCWDGISPQDLLDETTTTALSSCDNNELNSVKYCYDTLDHPFNNEGYECGVFPVCLWDHDLVGWYVDQYRDGFTPSKTPDDLIGNTDYKCPNGKLITRIIEFCSPDVENPPSNECDSFVTKPINTDDGTCVMDFCDFAEDDPWILTETTAPVTVTCPTDVHQKTDLGLCETTITYPPVISTTSNPNDTCRNGELELSLGGLPSGSLFPLGMTTNTFHDQNDKEACTFQVTVVDAEDPTLSCLSSITEFVSDNTKCTATVDFTAAYEVTDNCGIESIHSFGIPDDQLFSVGTTSVTYVATDTSGNEATCSVDVTVEDNQMPIITCQQSISAYVSSEDSTVQVTLSGAYDATDNCGAPSIQAIGIPNNQEFPVGTTVVTYEATDASGNMASCTVDVIVAVAVDQEPPTVTCSMTRECGGGGGCHFRAEWTAADNCGAVVTITGYVTSECFPEDIPIVSNGQIIEYFPVVTESETVDWNKGGCPAQGTKTATLVLEVMDESGNTATCEAVIGFSNKNKRRGLRSILA